MDEVGELSSEITAIIIVFTALQDARVKTRQRSDQFYSFEDMLRNPGQLYTSNLWDNVYVYFDELWQLQSLERDSSIFVCLTLVVIHQLKDASSMVGSSSR
jgi:hypothetical protein